MRILGGLLLSFEDMRISGCQFLSWRVRIFGSFTTHLDGTFRVGG